MSVSFFFSSRRRHTRCALVTGSSDVCSSDLGLVVAVFLQGLLDGGALDLLDVRGQGAAGGFARASTASAMAALRLPVRSSRACPALLQTSRAYPGGIYPPCRESGRTPCPEIGTESCRERMWQYCSVSVGAVSLK